MDDLTDSLKSCLANSFAFYLKAQGFHWNVEGPDFFQYHGLFEKIYTEVYESIDAFAELIRTLDDFAPGTLTELKNLSTLDDYSPAESRKMAQALLKDNDTVLLCLLSTYETAEKLGEVGVSNFIQDRITSHQKHGWFLKASIK
jgi:starvation-inducible DNA-binding protein